MFEEAPLETCEMTISYYHFYFLIRHTGTRRKEGRFKNFNEKSLSRLKRAHTTNMPGFVLKQAGSLVVYIRRRHRQVFAGFQKQNL